MIICEAKAYLLGNDVNTDYIISSRRKRDTLDPQLLKQYLLEDIRPGFFAELHSEAAILVAGTNMGCGSAMEVAAQILTVCNIRVLLALSFARSFYRNCINNGVIPVQLSPAEKETISEGDLLRVEMDNQEIKVYNYSQTVTLSFPSPQGEALSILVCGGIIPYMRRKAT